MHLLIKGKVQGVYFRQSARSLALDLGIRGWVRNTADGHVEILACGREEVLSAFTDWCQRGPERARVEEVLRIPSEHTPPEGFEILR